MEKSIKSNYNKEEKIKNLKLLWENMKNKMYPTQDKFDFESINNILNNNFLFKDKSS